METFLLVLALVVGLYMAWSIGANDVSNAMGTAVGSGALTLRQAVMVAAVLEFCGAYFFGSHVSDTVQKGIVNPEVFSSEPLLLVYGMISALVAAGVRLQIATYNGWPVSTTHSIIGALVGFGAVAGGMHAIYWDNVWHIGLSWLISPLAGGIIAFSVFSILRRRILYSSSPVAAAKALTPPLVFLLVTSLLSMVLVKGSDLTLPQAFGTAAGTGAIAALISFMLVRRVQPIVKPHERAQALDARTIVALEKARKHLQRARETTRGRIHEQISDALVDVDALAHHTAVPTYREGHRREYAAVERIFGYMQWITAGFMAFAHGANDVANAIGPLSAAVQVLQTGVVTMTTATPGWILALGGVGIITGLAMWGWRVIETIGKKITKLTPTRGFSAEFGAATTIVTFSALGMPISTTHTLVGAVLGVGLARGIGALNLTTIRDIVLSWAVTLPAGATIAVVVYHVLLWSLGTG